MPATMDAPAAQQLVGGLLLPRPLAGHPGLELGNTLAGWDPRRGRSLDGAREYLVDYAHLVALARGLDLLGPTVARELHRRAEADPAGAARVLGQARRLRSDLYAALVRRADREALERLSAVLSRASAGRSLVAMTPAGARWEQRDPGLRLPLDLLADQARRLLEDPAVTAVRTCPGDRCGWLFLDPRGQRRWCVMSLCGNRAKVRAHRQRAGE
jgi:predicted RNA-binding Zn ribbon-like protein